MLTANRIHQFLNTAREWDAVLRNSVTHANRPEPRVAVGENGVHFELDLPGRNRESIDVEVERNQLVVKVGELPSHSANDAKTIVNERSTHADEFRFQFPFKIDVDQTEVTFRDGLLSISVKKPAAEMARKLMVK